MFSMRMCVCVPACMLLCVFVCASKCLHLKGVAVITQLLLLQASPPSIRLPHNALVVQEKKKGSGRECIVELDQQGRGGGEEE